MWSTTGQRDGFDSNPCRFVPGPPGTWLQLTHVLSCTAPEKIACTLRTALPHLTQTQTMAASSKRQRTRSPSPSPSCSPDDESAYLSSSDSSATHATHTSDGCIAATTTGIHGVRLPGPGGVPAVVSEISPHRRHRRRHRRRRTECNSTVVGAATQEVSAVSAVSAPAGKIPYRVGITKRTSQGQLSCCCGAGEVE